MQTVPLSVKRSPVAFGSNFGSNELLTNWTEPEQKKTLKWASHALKTPQALKKVAPPAQQVEISLPTPLKTKASGRMSLKRSKLGSDLANSSPVSTASSTVSQNGPDALEKTQTNVQTGDNVQVGQNVNVQTQTLIENDTESKSQLKTPETKVKPRRQLRPRKALITLSDSAVEHLKNLLDQPDPQLIRIGVKNRGCSGLTYHLEYVSEPGKFDEMVEQSGVKVFIDSKALFSIVGSEMDWLDDKLSQRFVFKNPNSKGTCGCGESFMV